MLRKPSWIFTAIPTLVAALVAISVSQASQAATDQCLAAPNGAPPKGQHWYYHSDRATQRKCWYLHETVPTVAQPAAPAETVRPGNSATPSAPPADASAQPSGASVDRFNTSQGDDANAAFAAPKAAAPLQPAADRAAPPSGAMLWPTPPAPAGVQQADAAPGGGAAVAVPNTTDTPAATMHEEPDVQHAAIPVSTAAPDKPSTNSMGDNLLIIAMAAVLAAAVYAIFAVIFRRKPAKAAPADFFARFGLDADRQNAGRAPSRQSPPVQPSRIPQQLATPRPFVAPWWQERVKLDQRARVDQPSPVPVRPSTTYERTKT